jgi:hypothetical protein
MYHAQNVVLVLADAWALDNSAKAAWMKRVLQKKRVPRVLVAWTAPPKMLAGAPVRPLTGSPFQPCLPKAG